MAIWRIEACKGEFGHRSNTSIHQGVRDGLITKPVPIGARAVGWPDFEIRSICNARIAGQSEEQIRELVKRLHSDRAGLLAVNEAGPA
jgi:prophage regulatory protein